MPDRAFYTPPELAELLGIDPKKVIGFIRDGDLLAVNLARTKGKPRWKISRESFDRFLASRQSQPSPPMTKRRRKAEHVIEFY